MWPSSTVCLFRRTAYEKEKHLIHFVGVGKSQLTVTLSPDQKWLLIIEALQRVIINMPMTSCSTSFSSEQDVAVSPKYVSESIMDQMRVNKLKIWYKTDFVWLGSHGMHEVKTHHEWDHFSSERTYPSFQSPLEAGSVPACQMEAVYQLTSSWEKKTVNTLVPSSYSDLLFVLSISCSNLSDFV